MMRTLLTLVTLLVAATGLARPAQQTIYKENERVTVWLTVLKQYVEDDSTNFCLARVKYVNGDKDKWKLTTGDVVTVQLREDDGVDDEDPWGTTFEVTAAEAAAGTFDRTFSCSSDYGKDGWGTDTEDIELYLAAEVDLENCGTLCDDPDSETDVLDVLMVQDDKNEDDDTDEAAVPLGLGLNKDRVAADQDWFTFELASAAKVELNVEYDLVQLGETMLHAGKLDMVLFDDASVQLESAIDNDAGAGIVVNSLAEGIYFVRVSPRQSTDPNFYDVRFLVTYPGCTPQDTQEQDCPKCGTQTRVCDADGYWGDFGACEGQGPCEVGESKAQPCGNCGTQTMTCSETCAWAAGTCTNEGVCAAGTEESQACGAGGTQLRTCDEKCVWGAWGECSVGPECSNAMTKMCYSGPSSTRNVGECRVGVATCVNEAWGPCVDEVLPKAEACTNSKDDDCDGETDSADTDCQGTTPGPDVVTPTDVVVTPDTPVVTDTAVTTPDQGYVPIDIVTPTSSGGGGGGCAMNSTGSTGLPLALLLLIGLTLMRRRRTSP